MNVAVSGAAAGLYAPAQDQAVSPAGASLRSSVKAALEPPRPNRTAELFERVSTALRKGQAVEGALVDIESFAAMCDLLAVLPDDVPLPEIVVESEHEIGLDWSPSHRRALTATLDGSAFVGFAALIGHEPVYGRSPFTGTMPETLMYLLRRVYANDAGRSAKR